VPDILGGLKSAAGNVASGLSEGVQQLGGDLKKAAADAWKGAVDTAKSAISTPYKAAAAAAEQLVKEGTAAAADFRQGNIGSGIGHIGSGVKKAAEAHIATSWNGTKTTVATGLGTAKQVAHDIADGRKKFYNGTAKGAAKAVGNVAKAALGDAAGAKAERTAHHVATTLGQAMDAGNSFNLGVLEGAVEGAADMVVSTVELVPSAAKLAVGMARYNSDLGYQIEVNSRIAQTAMGLGERVKEAAAHPSEMIAGAYQRASKVVSHHVNEAARTGNFETIGEVVGEATFVVASTVVAPETVITKVGQGAKLAGAVAEVGRAAEAAGQVAKAEREVARAARAAAEIGDARKVLSADDLTVTVMRAEDLPGPIPVGGTTSNHSNDIIKAAREAKSPQTTGPGTPKPQYPDTNAAAQKAGYPPPPPGHYYRHSPDGSGFQLARHPPGSKEWVNPETNPAQHVVHNNGRPELAPAKQRVTADEGRAGVTARYSEPTNNAALERAIDAAGPRLTPFQRAYARHYEPVFKELEKHGVDPSKILDRVKGLSDGAAGQAIRHNLRAEMLDIINKAQPADRPDLLKRFLNAQPSNGDRGELFTQFRAENLPHGVEKVDPGPKSTTLANTSRRADGAIKITNPPPGAAKQGVKPGTYLAEDKAGPGAFQLDQAQRYSKALEDGGGVITAANEQRYQGIVYFFANDSDAQRTLSKLGGLHPNIHVAYYNAQGNVVWLR